MGIGIFLVVTQFAALSMGKSITTSSVQLIIIASIGAVMSPYEVEGENLHFFICYYYAPPKKNWKRERLKQLVGEIIKKIP